MSRSKKKLIILISTCILIIQTLTYLLSSPQSISSIALKLTPEHTHFSDDRAFKWICLRSSGSDTFDKQLIKQFKEKYSVVYEDVDQIPPKLSTKDSEGRWLGFKDGFIFSFNIKSEGLFWMKVTHGDLVGSLAGSSSEHLYIWILGKWVKVYTRRMFMS